MLVRRGIAVSPGVVSGPALVLGAEDFRIPNHFVRVDAVETEVGRFHAALEAVFRELADNEELASEQLGKQYGQIFHAHLEMARDPGLLAEIEKLIRKKCYSPEFASSYVLGRRAKVLQNLDNHFLRERAADVFDLKRRILGRLLGERREELANLTTPVVVLAHNLTPGETARLNKDHSQFVQGFATEVGGPTSHTAIIAGALEIPAVVGVGNFLSDVSGGETVIIDGNHGEVIIDPDEETKARYRDTQQRFRTVAQRLSGLRELKSETKDGARIELMGNIEFPDEVDHCTERGADGIGLYRTEFLFLEKGREPTEDDHYEAYCRVIAAFPEKPVVIRTLDLGADKAAGAYTPPPKEGLNPVLGLRSIRLSLKNLPLFKTQLRAILRAAVRGDVRLMFPLVSSLLELRHAKMILSDVMEDLEEQGLPFQRDLPVGMMVEVPAAVIMAEEFSREVDFFSIGTNDLIQYTLAVDRADPAVASLYSSGDPSIIRLIRAVIEAARKRGIPVTVCGQMSSEPIYIPLLVGLGLRQLSVTPHAIPELKEVIRNITVGQAEAIAAHVATLELARDVESYLRGELKKICPDLVL
ncbi:MAG TPA: phosphoenolpyruvate--protein phosphotransferase [Planctomycetaceae bacterium]|nr:phosphoenolpyruvate--protein phosphotransferase [Planctomycetaceae bacterium]